MGVSGGPVPVVSANVTSTTLSTWYTIALHLGGLAAVTILIALGDVTWAEGGPILGALVGYGVASGQTQAVVQSLAASTKTQAQ